MKPKNSKERRNSFLKFIALFVFTVALIVTAFFFDFDRVPLKESRVLRAEANQIEKDIQFEKKFSKEMKQMDLLIDSLDAQGANTSFLRSDINKRILELDKGIPVETIKYKYDMYKDILEHYKNIPVLKDELSRVDKLNEDITKCAETNKELTQEVEKLERLYNARRN